MDEVLDSTANASAGFPGREDTVYLIDAFGLGIDVSRILPLAGADARGTCA